MKTRSIPGRPARLLAVVVFYLGCGAPLLAQPLPLAGRWAADEPTEARTTLAIRDGRLSWHEGRTSAPACARQFELKREAPGTVYVNGRGTRFVAGAPGSIPTYLLKLDAGTCGTAGDTVRVNFPLIYDRDHIELIEYVAGKPVGARRFHRRK